MEVDWAGSTLAVTDSITGEPVTAYVFVACLPCSMYSYAEAVPDMKTASWIQAHIHAYSYFGGVTRILTPDNAKMCIRDRVYIVIFSAMDIAYDIRGLHVIDIHMKSVEGKAGKVLNVFRRAKRVAALKAEYGIDISSVSYTHLHLYQQAEYLWRPCSQNDENAVPCQYHGAGNHSGACGSPAEDDRSSCLLYTSRCV